MKVFSKKELERSIYKMQLFQIMLIVNSIRKIDERIDILLKKGFIIRERAMGPGGVGSVKLISNEMRVQIGCAKGKYNYAMCVIL